MWGFFRFLLRTPLLRPITRPVMRLIVGVLAVPLFRLFLRRVVRLQELDGELEKDLEQWFRGSLLLLAATHNMEHLLFPWVTVPQGDVILLAFRLLLAMGVVEAMPDQALFAILYPGPPKLKWERGKGLWRQVREQAGPVFKGALCQHLNRSSPVLAILAAIQPGWIGWTCYVVAIVQYLIIGLVTSRDKALDVLGQFDREVARRRQELVDEFITDESGSQSRARRSRAVPGDGATVDKAADSGNSPPPIVAKEES